MGQPESKRAAMLDPRHRAMLLKEKYRQQLAERQEPESDSAETQAVDEVEGAANWAGGHGAGSCSAGAEGKAKATDKGEIVCEYPA